MFVNNHSQSLQSPQSLLSAFAPRTKCSQSCCLNLSNILSFAYFFPCLSKISLPFNCQFYIAWVKHLYMYYFVISAKYKTSPLSKKVTVISKLLFESPHISRSPIIIWQGRCNWEKKGIILMWCEHKDVNTSRILYHCTIYSLIFHNQKYFHDKK